MRCVILEAGCLLATPTSSWQHHIEPQSAFPQQLLQITKIFSLRPPTFLSIKTNELTLTLTPTLTWPTESSQSPPRLPAPLHPHSDSPLYLTHSTTNLSGGAQGDSAQGLHAAGRPDLTTWSDDNTCRWAQSLSTCFVVSWTLCISTDCWLWGVSVHISMSTPPTNSTLSPIWAPTVRRNPPPPTWTCLFGSRTVHGSPNCMTKRWLCNPKA